VTTRLRNRRAALVLGVLGAGMALLTLTVTWATLGAGTVPASQLTGRQVVPGAFALALAALAGTAALLLLGRVGRRAAGVLLVLLGVGTALVAVSGARGLADGSLLPSSWTASGAEPVSTSPIWAVGAVLGGLLVIAAGALALLGGPGWTDTPSRYSRAGRPADTDLWRSLDEGRDPTADPAGGQ
jgi:Tryptophan-associated transmembrane protein (Trp_oprn_chp)